MLLSIIPRLCFTLALILVFGIHTRVHAEGVEEASGITRLDDMLLIVGDKTPGAYYTYPLAKSARAGHYSGPSSSNPNPT
jgi:hypothetical protein